MEAVVIEVYDPRGHVRFRQKLGTLPATIGRAFACDVILDDPLVSERHARLEEDVSGTLTLVDTGSRNGILVDGGKVERVSFPTAKRVKLGSSRISVVRASAPREQTGLHRISRLDQPWLLAPALALAAVATYFQVWLQAREVKPLQLIGDHVLPALLMVASWALVWAIATRIAQGRFGFVGHLTLASFALGSATLLRQAVVSPLAFVLRIPSVVDDLTRVGVLAIAALMLGTQLQRVTGWSRRRCLAISYAFAAGIVTISGFNRLAKVDEFAAELHLASVTMPPAFVVGPVGSVEAFVADTQRLQDEVDALRAPAKP